jgi:hypothetical protein
MRSAAQEPDMRPAHAISIAVDNDSKSASPAQAGGWTTKSIMWASLAAAFVVAAIVGFGAGFGTRASETAGASSSGDGGANLDDSEQLLVSDNEILGSNFPYAWARANVPNPGFEPDVADFAVSGLGRYVWLVLWKEDGKTHKSKTFFSNDYGKSWREREVPVRARQVATDSYGEHVWLIADDGLLAISSNFGMTFRESDAIKNWPGASEARAIKDIAASEDGRKVVVGGALRVWISTNYGKDSWVMRSEDEFPKTLMYEPGKASIYNHLAVSRTGDVIVVGSARLNPRISMNNAGFSVRLQNRRVAGTDALATSGDGKRWILGDHSEVNRRDTSVYWSDDFGQTVRRIGSDTDYPRGAVCDYDASVCVVALGDDKGNSKILVTDGRDIDRPDVRCKWTSVGCSRYNGCQQIYLYCASSHQVYRLEKQL